MSLLISVSVLWTLAIPMAYAIAWIVKRGALAKSSVEYASVFFLLIMMISMFFGALIYVLNQTISSIIEAVVINMSVMTLGILLVLKYWGEDKTEKEENLETEQIGDRELERSVVITRAYVVYFVVFVASMVSFAFLYIVDHTTTGTEMALGSGMGIMTAGVLLILRYSLRHELARGETETRSRLGRSLSFRLAVIFLVLLNEFLMGWVFSQASGISGTSIGTNPLWLFGNVVSSYWFIFIMVLEMVLTILMFRNEVPRRFSTILGLQASVMLFSPPAVESQTWLIGSICVSSGLMIVLFIYLYQSLYRNKSFERTTRIYTLRLIAIYSMMLAGLFIWIEYHNPILFSISIVAQMVLYFNAIVNPFVFGLTKGKSYNRQPPLA